MDCTQLNMKTHINLYSFYKNLAITKCQIANCSSYKNNKTIRNDALLSSINVWKTHCDPNSIDPHLDK